MTRSWSGISAADGVTGRSAGSSCITVLRLRSVKASRSDRGQSGGTVAVSKGNETAIGMRAHGPLMLDRFGDGELEGWSAMQFIQTSSITVHTDEVGDRCFVDVFSGRPFDSGAAAAVAVAQFGGTFTLRVLHR